jgi:4-carboxymuconolactone decarboxylase
MSHAASGSAPPRWHGAAMAGIMRPTKHDTKGPPVSRLPDLDYEKMDARQRGICDALKNSPRGRVSGPFPILLRTPELCDRFQHLGRYLRFECSLDKQLIELVVLTVARHFRAQYEFWAHARFARDFGLPDAVIDAIAAGERPEPPGERHALLYDYTREILETARCSQATYDRVLAEFGAETFVEIAVLAGYYSAGAVLMNTFEVMPPDGALPMEEPQP